ncbi:MAG: DUF429 domain-containing protein [Burkholderiaceae bacterium]
MAEPEARSLLLGCDFTSRPSRQKPIVLACGSLRQGRVVLSKIEKLETLASFAAWLSQPGDWLGAFDLPFGLPRELVERLSWPTRWEDCIRYYVSLSREEIRCTFKSFCDGRPVGGKFAHRSTDRVAASSPSMKWVNPPVAYMLHAGLPGLLASGATIAGLKAGDTRRVALEGYPGLLAREILGQRSYKADEKSRQNHERLIARKDLLTALELGQTRLGLRLKLSHAQRDSLVDDGRGDLLDAVLCLVQAAWASEQGGPLYGLPKEMDPLEGWVVTA